ncbi:MAG TPA: hypothetical protein VJA21_20835, partial [Verrucomicrobiae bacterium]
AQKVTGPSSCLVGYENDLESMRDVVESLRQASGPGTNTAAGSSMLPAGMNLSGPARIFRDWVDFSQLPPFDKISKFFHFTIYGGSATVDGLTLKMFAPVPPGLKP